MRQVKTKRTQSGLLVNTIQYVRDMSAIFEKMGSSPLSEETVQRTADRVLKALEGVQGLREPKRKSPPRLRKGGLEPIPKVNRCTHPGHNPPMHIAIPGGKQYRHICPGCGKTCVLRGSIAYMNGDYNTVAWDE